MTGVRINLDNQHNQKNNICKKLYKYYFFIYYLVIQSSSFCLLWIEITFFMRLVLCNTR